MNEKIRNTFDSIASKYDSNRKKLIPCFDELYSIPISLIPETSSALNVLDIGAGTGLLTSFLLEKYPYSNVTLIDMAEGMLDIAKMRFKDKENVNYIAGDYIEHDFGGTFDAIISAMSIHHLPDAEKQRLFTKIYIHLKPGGIFVNAEQVSGNTDTIETYYKKEWERTIRESGVPEEEIASWKERLKLDRESTVGQKINWLKEAGFADADCAYKFYKFAVIFGIK
ncbi:MAG: class I SAM-dependent methyltransferase [bacterium]